MTEKELRELKRRFRPERTNIPKLVGCFVNTNGEIIANISQPMLSGESAVTERLLNSMKKVLSGTLGANLCEIDFTTRDVGSSEEHKLLMRLRDSALSDTEALGEFYKKVTENVKLESNYVILLANDIYDVTEKTADGEGADSVSRFSYVVAAVCPIKQPPEALCFREGENLFHIAASTGLLSAAELGFTFPLFDDRKTNIYGALFYKKSLTESHAAFCEAIFGKEAPMPPKQQRATFGELLCEALEEDVSLELLRSVRAQFCEIADAHRESHNPEVLTVTKATVCEVLRNTGTAEEKIEKLAASLDESFGENAPLSPSNIVELKKFEVATPDVTIKVSPDRQDLVSTQIIDGVKYIMIRAEGGVILNGIAISEEKND